MKIISTFLFARPYERDVLLAKFYSEYEYIDEFIGIECAYDLHGNPKDICLNSILEHDDFSPFKNKITVLSSETSLYPVNNPYSESNNLICEFNSRAYCWDYVKAKFSDNDWLLMEDADEMFDFSNPIRRDILLNYFNSYNEGIQIFNTRYWWDFDNLSVYEKYIPCHKVGALKERERPFDHRNRHCKMIKPDISCAFEYSHCFPREGNWIKVTTSAHDKYKWETMENAYKYNTWHKEPARGEALQYPLDFFETIELTEKNSPNFVLENIDKLKVNTVDINYAANRKGNFGLPHPHPLEQYDLLGGSRINKQYHYYRRSK